MYHVERYDPVENKKEYRFNLLTPMDEDELKDHYEFYRNQLKWFFKKLQVGQSISVCVYNGGDV